MLNFCPKWGSMYELVLIRGMSGSGKTTFGKSLLNIGSPLIYSFFAADDFFVDEEGNYNFNPKKLPYAHEWCQGKVENSMSNRLSSRIVVHNTFTQRWEMEPYLQLADKYDYSVTVVSLYDGGCSDEELVSRNQHGVDIKGISNMRERWEHDWRMGDPRPPWLRESV